MTPAAGADQPANGLPAVPCALCQARGKTWNGDDPTCAFLAGVFQPDNWNCATMHALRIIADARKCYNEDQYAAVFPANDCGDFIALSWYKSRGKTEGAWFLSESKAMPLSIEEAQEAIEHAAALRAVEAGGEGAG